MWCIALGMNESILCLNLAFFFSERPPFIDQGGRPLEEGLRLRKGQRPERIGSYFQPRTILLPVDVGYYAPAARTTLNRVFLCACLSARLAQSPSTSPSTPSLGIDGCVPPPGCGYPRNPTTFGAIRGEVRRRLDLRASGPCSSSATTSEKMKEGRATLTPRAMALGHQRPRCGGARQRRLLCVATATPQSRRGSAQRGRRWALLPLRRLKVFSQATATPPLRWHGVGSRLSLNMEPGADSHPGGS